MYCFALLALLVSIFPSSSYEVSLSCSLETSISSSYVVGPTGSGGVGVVGPTGSGGVGVVGPTGSGGEGVVGPTGSGGVGVVGVTGSGGVGVVDWSLSIADVRFPDFVVVWTTTS